MKVALILSGQFRNAKECYNSIKNNILDVYSPDVFISSWLNPKDITPSGWFGHTPNDDCTINDVINMYNPISIEMETFDTNINKPFKNLSDKLDSLLPENTETKTINVVSMHYKRYKANQLKKNYENLNNFKYDIVISSRFDLEFLEKLNLEENNSVNIPIGFDWANGISDLFAYGKSDIMDEYFNLFNMFEFYRLNKNISYAPEYNLKYHLDFKELNVSRFLLHYRLRGVNIWEVPN